MMFSTDTEQWAKETVQHADLGDSRRTKHLAFTGRIDVIKR
ncbi:transposase [Xenorhabdus sp. KJ12.1]|nr:transposase [Xenorhabdus sp. KJ12.1]